MTTNNSTNISFDFRNKFQDRLLNKENRFVFVVAFDRFCNYHKELAKKVLWRLTYNDGFFESDLKSLGLNLEIVPLNRISTLRDELRFQYNIQHPGFLEPQLPDNAECMEAYNTLKNHADEIVSITVLEYCYNNLYAEEESRNKVLALLESSKENCYFGGLRQMGFPYKATSYLMPYHAQVYALFKALCDSTHKNASSFKNIPFEELDKQLDVAGIELPFEFTENLETPVDETHAEEKTVQTAVPQAEEPAKPCSEFKPLTPENILEHRNVFESLCGGYYSIDTILDISKLGFDLNKVILKREVIYKVLEINLSIEKADEMLHEAESAKEKAKNDMAMVAKALAE